MNQIGPYSLLNKISILPSFEALVILHGIGLVSIAMNIRSLRIHQVYSNGTLIRRFVHLVAKARLELFDKAHLSRLFKARIPYIC